MCDWPSHSSLSQDLTLLYPWSKIREDAESQKDILGAKNIKQTYETISKGKNWLQGTLRGLKGKGGACGLSCCLHLGEGMPRGTCLWGDTGCAVRL